MAAQGQDNRRALIILAAGLGLVAVIFVVTQILGGDDGDEDAVPPVTTTSEATGPGVPGADANEGDAFLPIPDAPDLFEIVELRNPFEPLHISAITDEDGGGSDGGGGVDDGVPGGATLVLEAIVDEGGAPIAEITVDGELYRVGEGERFGASDEYEVVSLDIASQCGLFRFGDEPFTLCVGEEIAPK